MIFLGDQNPTSAPLNNRNFINETKFLSSLKTINSAVQHTSLAWQPNSHPPTTLFIISGKSVERNQLSSHLPRLLCLPNLIQDSGSSKANINKILVLPNIAICGVKKQLPHLKYYTTNYILFNSELSQKFKGLHSLSTLS